MTPVNNPCHGFLLIAGVVDTGDKFLTCDNDTYDKFIVTTTPVNNFIASDKDKDAMEMGSCQGESWKGHIGDISGRRSQTQLPMVSLEPPGRHPTNLIRDPWGCEN